MTPQEIELINRLMDEGIQGLVYMVIFVVLALIGVFAYLIRTTGRDSEQSNQVMASLTSLAGMIAGDYRTLVAAVEEQGKAVKGASDNILSLASIVQDNMHTVRQLVQEMAGRKAQEDRLAVAVENLVTLDTATRPQIQFVRKRIEELTARVDAMEKERGHEGRTDSTGGAAAALDAGAGLESETHAGAGAGDAHTDAASDTDSAF